MRKYIPQIEPWIDNSELHELAKVINSTFITEHDKTEEFIHLIKQYTGSKYAIAMSNATVSLVACLLAENIGQGDEVIVPDLTFIASANAVLLVGATPVFCDVLPDTGCIDPNHCERLINNHTRAIMPVHLYGQSAEMVSVLEIASRHHLLVIEDAAESLGVHYNGKHTGTFGDYGVFSFFANKVVTCGEGGVVLTNDEKKYKKLYRVKNHGRDRKGIFIHENIGYNFCFSDLHAAVGVAQLHKLPTIIERKSNNFNIYKQRFMNQKSVKLMEPADNVSSNYWFCCILTEEVPRLAKFLEEKGIGTRRFFYPLHLQPCYKERFKLDHAYTITNKLYESGLSLPSSPLLTNDELNYICDSIIDFFH